MTNPHNVDICVTCVSEKPPQLPLREELPSLGIEVIYNAHGVGATASKQEQEKKFQKFQKRRQGKNKFGMKQFFLRGKSKKRAEEDRKREEKESMVPHALSYSSYQQRLHHFQEELGAEEGSWQGQGSSLESHSMTADPNRSEGIDRQSDSLGPILPTSGDLVVPPISNVEFSAQSPEEDAVKEAFNVFSTEVPDLYGSVSENHTEPPVQAEGASDMRESPATFPEIEPVVGRTSDDKAPAESAFDFGATISNFLTQDASTFESFQDLAQQYLSKHISPSHHQQPNDGKEILVDEHKHPEGDEEVHRQDAVDTVRQPKSVKVSRYNKNDTTSEFYDLTAISDEENTEKLEFQAEINEEVTLSSVNDLSTLSSMKDPPARSGVQIVPSAAIREQLPGLKLQIPEEDDGYGRIVMDLSDVMEENGPGSRLIYSPSQENNNLTAYIDEFEEREGGDTVASMRNIGSTTSNSGQFVGVGTNYDRKLSVLGTRKTTSLFDDSSTFGLSYSQRFTFDESRRASHDQEISEPVTSQRRQFFMQPASPHPSFTSPTREPAPLSPSLKTSLSRDSDIARPKLSVSFSHDVEARQYLEQEQIHSFDDVSSFGETRRRVETSGTSRSPFDPVGARQIIENIKSPDEQLLESLRNGTSLPANVEQILIRNPAFAYQKFEGTRTYPLHAACAREFDNRFEDDKPGLIKDLVNDIILRKSLISALVKANSGICRRLDENGDLPVHIIARKMMEWEAHWYQKVYENAKGENQDKSDSSNGITTLYQTMSQIVDILLRPLAQGETHCQQAGSVGFILPLHIAAMFTVSYDTLRILIEQYPEAMRQKCNLDDVRTFIPNYSLPLELHNRLSTDFPKWEIEASNIDDTNEIQWTQSTLDRSYGTVGGMRRSDLMFAYYPSVTPYRNELPRIRRLESRIRSEVEEVESEFQAVLSPPLKLVWEWMCTFKGDDKDDHYAESVRRILKSLPLRSVKLLASMPCAHNMPVTEVAIPQCLTVMRKRLGEISNSMIPVPIAPLATGFASQERSSLLREFDVNRATRFCLQGRGFIGVLCRTLFNITETAFPTNFVLLPYKLVKDNEGRLGLESAEAAAVAMKFADSLLHLTDPDKILHFLEKKAIRFSGTSLGVQASSDWDVVEALTKHHINNLLSLYADTEAYFYFLDEYTGAPIVPDHEDSVYPLIVSEASETVRKLLPMMLGGMILMRGEKALPIMAEVLLNENVKVVQENWVEAAKDLVGYLCSAHTEQFQDSIQNIGSLRSMLIDFIKSGVSDNAPTPGHNDLTSEWVVESSLAKMIVEMHDPNHTLSGLRVRRSGMQVLWTRERSFLDPASNDHLMKIDFRSSHDLQEAFQDSREHNFKVGSEREDIEQVKAVDSSSIRKEDTKAESKQGEDGYGLLFKELSFKSRQMSETRAEAKAMRENPGLRDTEVESSSSRSTSPSMDDVPEPPAIVRRRLPATSAMEPISLINFDEEDELNLDGVLQLRILLDEQEAKLEFLKEKVDDLRVGESELLDEEERLSDLLDSANNQKGDFLADPSNKGLASARGLLMRLCELEDRVLCREVEVGQLKNNISCFELEAAEKRKKDVLYDLL